MFDYEAFEQMQRFTEQYQEGAEHADYIMRGMSALSTLDTAETLMKMGRPAEAQTAARGWHSALEDLGVPTLPDLILGIYSHWQELDQNPKSHELAQEYLPPMMGIIEPFKEQARNIKPYMDRQIEGIRERLQSEEEERDRLSGVIGEVESKQETLEARLEKIDP